MIKKTTRRSSKKNMVLSVSILAAIIFFSFGLKKKLWYPFPNNFFSRYYTTGPFSLSTNIQETRKIWPELKEINKTISRQSYLMRQGDNYAQIAWLYPKAEWEDDASFNVLKIRPNKKESDVSKILKYNGYCYDRISRNNLQAASIKDNQLIVGQSAYQCLIVDQLNSASPELLEKIALISNMGIPVIFLDQLPCRAYGWKDQEKNDNRVKELNNTLKQKVSFAKKTEDLPSLLESKNIIPIIKQSSKKPSRLPINVRHLDDGYLILVFNEEKRSKEISFTINLPYLDIQLLNPQNGSIEELHNQGALLNIKIPKYQSRIIWISNQDKTLDLSAWDNPPADFRPYLRWWWPGSDVEQKELLRELKLFKEAGFGGVELQTLTIGLPKKYLRQNKDKLYNVGSDQYFDDVKFVMENAEEIGLKVDMTMGSGWSSGGPFIKEHKESQLISTHEDVKGPRQYNCAIPTVTSHQNIQKSNIIIKNVVGEFDKNIQLVSAVAIKENSLKSSVDPKEIIDLMPFIQNNVLNWEVPKGKYRLFYIYRNNSSHNVVGSAYTDGYETSPIVDHLSKNGAEEYIAGLAIPWTNSIKPYKPESFFIDSFELVGELPWTEAFDKKFMEIHGYDIKRYLPLIFKKGGESKYTEFLFSGKLKYRLSDEMSQRIREDYEHVRELLFYEEFLTPLKKWMNEHDIQLRLQAHGGFGDLLDCYQLADIPESEGLYGGGSYDFLKMASSAGHIKGHNIISSESFINITLNQDKLKKDHYYLLSGNAFSAGINRIIYHGYAYHYEYR